MNLGNAFAIVGICALQWLAGFAVAQDAASQTTPQTIALESQYAVDRLLDSLDRFERVSLSFTSSSMVADRSGQEEQRSVNGAARNNAHSSTGVVARCRRLNAGFMVARSGVG